LKLHWHAGRKAWLNLYLNDQKTGKAVWMLTVLEGKQCTH
jgi:hypothetical protein